VAVFIVGSFFCGLAPSLVVLIAMRAVQGIGGGGLTVTATALIGDVIPLRDRGKYQAAFTPPSQFAQRPAGSWITSPG